MTNLDTASHPTGTTPPPPPGDPRALFGSAVRTATSVIGAVRPAQLADPTPCDELDVRGILGHLTAVLHRVAALGRGEDPMAVGDVDVPDDDWTGAWAEAAHAVQAAWTDDAVLDRAMSLPWRQGTGAEILTSYLSEITVHTWDLAQGTGRSPAWDDEVVAAALADAGGLPAEGRRELFAQVSREMGLEAVAVPFADAVPVDAHAAPIDRLVAWTGRRPS